jgi:hypothetical protein
MKNVNTKLKTESDIRIFKTFLGWTNILIPFYNIYSTYIEIRLVEPVPRDIYQNIVFPSQQYRISLIRNSQDLTLWSNNAIGWILWSSDTLGYYEISKLPHKTGYCKYLFNIIHLFPVHKGDIIHLFPLHKGDMKIFQDLTLWSNNAINSRDVPK